MAFRFVTLLALCGTVLADSATETFSLASTVSIDTTAENTPANTALVTQPVQPVQQKGGSKADSYKGPAFLLKDKIASLVNQLPQNQTNGASLLGTLKAPKLPSWLDGTPLPNGFPWGGRTVSNTDPYKNPPETGVTRRYDFSITKLDIWPDGVHKQAIVVNGAFPGPTIEANWGDYIEVAVHNNMDEGTSLHWHGLLQKTSQWMDGVPSVQQCPIAPGSSFTYRFKADLYGTSWWHSHFSAQYAGGLLGPMIIYGPHDNAQYDEDLGPVLLTDWYHASYNQLVDVVMAPAALQLFPPLSNNNLINGKMNYPCDTLNSTTECIPDAGVSKFNFTTGKTYRLRLINAGAEGTQKFSIDNHTMTIIANDFVPVKPYKADVITLGIGQRTDIIVTATAGSTSAVWMRSTLGTSVFDGGCTLNDGVSPEAVAAIYYQNANTTVQPNTTSSVSTSAIENCYNDALTTSEPYFSITPPSRPDVTKQINVTFQSNGTHNLFFMNNSSFRADFNDPILLETKAGNFKFEPQWNVYNMGQANSIRIILYNHAFVSAHPMHIHGHNMYILAEGHGNWDGKVTRPGNPQRRDVQLMQNALQDGTPAYLVMQIDADNPGVWPFHCHIAWHVSAGLYINILERPWDIWKLPIPNVMAQTCREWAAWTGNHVVDVIDSGL